MKRAAGAELFAGVAQISTSCILDLYITTKIPFGTMNPCHRAVRDRSTPEWKA